MNQAAKELDFERAALLRDEIKRLKRGKGNISDRNIYVIYDTVIPDGVKQKNGKKQDYYKRCP